MILTLTWTPDLILLTNLAKIADQKGQTLESTLSEAVQLYLIIFRKSIHRNSKHST